MTWSVVDEGYGSNFPRAPGVLTFVVQVIVVVVVILSTCGTSISTAPEGSGTRTRGTREERYRRRHGRAKQSIDGTHEVGRNRECGSGSKPTVIDGNDRRAICLPSSFRRFDRESCHQCA